MLLAKHRRSFQALTGVAPSAIFRVAAMLVVFSLGVYGFHQAYGARGTEHLGTYTYRAFQLIVGQFPGELANRPLPVSLQIARWTLPLLTLWTTATLAWGQVRNSVRTALIRMRGEHLVAAGDGAVAGRIVHGERAADRPVIVWTADKRASWVQDAADAGAPHVFTQGEASGAGKLGLDKARAVLLAGPDDATNIALVSAAAETALKVRTPGDPLTLIARVDDPDLRAPLEQKFDWAAERSILRVRFASLPEITARQMFLRLPLDRFQRGETVDRRAFLLGFSATSERYVLRLLAAAHYRGGAKPQLVVLDQEADRKREVFLARRPGAANLVPVAFEPAPLDQPSLVGKALEAALEKHGLPSAVFVDPPDPARALALALAVEDVFRKRGEIAPPVYVRLPEGAAETDLSCAVTPYGGLEALTDPETLLQEQRDALARAAHEFYFEGRLEAGDAVGSRASMYEWDQLPEAVRDDNRLVSDSFELKLRDVGARLLEGRDAGGGFRFRDDELEELSRAEHDRWMAAKLIDGWVFGAKRDDAAKRHPDIVPYDDLSEAIKDLDREQVRVITRLVDSAGRHAARDLVVAIEPGAMSPNLNLALAELAKRYPDRAIVLLADFSDAAARSAVMATGLPVRLLVPADPEIAVASRPRGEAAALRGLYRGADRIYAVPGLSLDERRALMARLADVRIAGEGAAAGEDPTVAVNAAGAITAAPWAL